MLSICCVPRTLGAARCCAHFATTTVKAFFLTVGLLTPAGFLFFVGLTVWMVTAHPTPRAMDYEPLEDLWESAQDSMHSLGDHIGEGMHVLQVLVPSHTIHRLGNKKFCL